MAYDVHRVETTDNFLGDRITPEKPDAVDVYDVLCVPSR